MRGHVAGVIRVDMRRTVAMTRRRMVSSSMNVVVGLRVRAPVRVPAVVLPVRMIVIVRMVMPMRMVVIVTGIAVCRRVRVRVTLGRQGRFERSRAGRFVVVVVVDLDGGTDAAQATQHEILVPQVEVVRQGGLDLLRDGVEIRAKRGQASEEHVSARAANTVKS